MKLAFVMLVGLATATLVLATPVANVNEETVRFPSFANAH